MSELSEKIRKRREETDFDKLQANFRKNYNPGFLSSVGHNLLGGVEALGGGVAKGLGQFFQSDTLEDIGDNLSNEAQNLNEIYGTNEKYKDMGFFDRLTNLDYLTDPRGLTASVTNGFGSSLPLLALTAAFPEFTIPGAIARGGAAKLLGEAGANWVTRKGIDKFLNAGTKFATVSTPFDALSAQSEMIEYLRRQGYSESEITRRIIDGMIEEYPMDMLANMASGGLLMGKLPFMQGSSLSKRILKGIGATGLDMFLGGNQEMYQDQVMKRHANLPAGTLFNPLPEEEQTRTEAMFGEMFPGVVATARDAVFGDSKAQEPPAEDQSTNFNGVPVLNQADARWGDKPYRYRDGGENSIAQSACAPTALTMLLNKYGVDAKVENIVDEMTPYHVNGGTEHQGLIDVAKNHGIGLKSTQDIDEVKQVLQSGNAVVAAHGPGMFTSYGHFVVYAGLDKDGKVVVNNPNGGTQEKYDLNEVLQDLQNSDGVAFIPTKDNQELSQNQYDPNFSEIENRMWQNAQHVAKRMKDEFGWDVDPALIYGQWYHESGGFKSRAAKEINNFAGLMQKEPNGEENRQTDGDLYFKMYDSPEQFADDYIDSFMNPRLYPEMANVKTAEDFRDMLFGTGYVKEGSYDGYLADIKYGMANHPNVGYNGGRVTPTTQKEAGAGNQPNQTEIPRPLFDLNDLINQDNIESGLTNAIVSDYLKQLQQSGNDNQKNLSNQMLDQDGEFRFTPQNLNQVVQTEGQNIVDFAIENEGRYLAPQEVRERLAQQQLLRKANALYANDFETARDADEKINYWMNYGRKPKESKPEEIKSKKPPEWKLPQNGMTQEEKDNRMQELLARRLTAEMQGDQDALRRIETQMKQLRNAPIIDNKPSENPVQNPPTDQTQQPTEDQSQIPPVEENQPKPRRTPPEILDAVKLTGKKPKDAGDLHVEMLDDNKVKLLGTMGKPKNPKQKPAAFNGLKDIAKEIGGTFNSRSKTFNFQNPEDAELFSQTAFAYLDNGFESLKPKSQSQTQQSTRPLSTTEQTIYDAIPETSSISPDELIAKTGLNTSKVVANLSAMEKAGIINKDDLGNFSRIPSNKPTIQSNIETQPDTSAIKQPAPRNDNESKVADALSTGNPMSIDEIIARTGIGIPKIFDTLSSMEKSGVIKRDEMDNYELTDKTQIKPESKPKDKQKSLDYNQWLKSHEEDAKNPRIKRVIDRTKDRVKNLTESYGEDGNPLEMDTEIDTILRNAENAINKLKDDIAHQSPKETIDENQSNDNGDNNDNNESDEKSEKTFNTFLKNLSPKFALEVQNALTPKLRAKIESLARDDNSEFKFENGQYTINGEQISRHAAAYLNYLRYTNGGEFLAKETPRFLETLHFELDTNRKPTDKEIADGTYIETNEHLRPLLYRKLKVSEYPELKRWIDRELKMPANGYEDELRIQRHNRLQKLWKNDISDATLKQMEDDFKADREVVIPGIDDAPETKKSPPAITLPEGYRTESGRDINEADKDEFIVDKDGNRDFGEISKKIEEITKGVVKSAPVRLTVGFQNQRHNSGNGYKHIAIKHDKDIKEKGFDNPIDFVQYILKNFNQIYKPEDNRIILYCDGDESIGYMPMDLEIEQGKDYYRIISAYPHKPKKIKEKPVYDSRHTQPSTDSVDGATQSSENNKDGVLTERAIEKTDSSLEESVTSNESEDNDSDSNSPKILNRRVIDENDLTDEDVDELIKVSEQMEQEKAEEENIIDISEDEVEYVDEDQKQLLLNSGNKASDSEEVQVNSATDIKDKLQKRYDDIVADARDAVDQFLARNNAKDSRDDFFTRTLDYIAARTDLKNIRSKKSFDEDEITQSLDEFESRLKSLISTETKKATQSLENKSNQSESSTQESTPKRKPKKKSIEIKEHIEETPQEILKKEHLTTHPPDAGNLHVDVQVPEINKPIEVKLEGKAKRSKASVAIPGLTKLARHFDAMFNESQKIFKFQLLEDANLFAQTAFKYLNNGNECVTFTPIFAESNENNDDIANQDFGDAIELLDNQMEGLNGKSLKVFSDNNKEFNARYKIVDASELITSHEYLGLGYGINREYPQALQPRDRLRVAMQDGISKMAGSIVPEQITDSRYLNQGAPVVRSDGVVLNGNGRTLALITAYSRKQADKYRNYLIEHAEEFGIDADEIAKMDKPILIREITDTLDEARTLEIINSTVGGSRLGGSEKAVNDSKKLTLHDLYGYESNDTGDLTTAANQSYAWQIANKIIPQSEINEYTDERGQISSDGYQRIRRAIFATAYQNQELIAKMTQSTDDDIKNISNAILYAAPEIAHVNLAMKEKQAYQYDLSKTISDAVTRYDEIKKGDGNVQHFIKQNETAFFDKAPDEVIQLLTIFEANKRNAKGLERFLAGIARAIEAQGNPQNVGLFGDSVQNETMMDIINRVTSATFFEQPSLLDTQDNSAKKSVKNNRYNYLKNLKILRQSQLTSREKSIQDLGKQLGVPVVFFEGNKNLHGYFAGGTSFINRNSATSLEWTFWHESFHAMQAQNPNLYNQILSEIKKSQSFTDKQIDAYRKEIGAFSLSDDEVIEEMLADNMQDAAKRSGIIDSLRGNRNLFQKFVDFVRDLYNQVKDFFNAPKNKLTQAQRDAMNRSVSRIASSMNKLGINPNEAIKRSEKKSVVEVTGKEFGDWSDIKDLRRKAIEYYTNYLTKHPVKSDLLGQITFTPDAIVEFTGSGRNEVKSHSANPNKLLLIKHLPQLIESAVRARETAHHKEKHRDKTFYYLRSYAKVDGEYHHINITVFRSNDKHFMFYNHDIKGIVTEEEATKNEGEPLSSAAPESSNEALGSQRIGSPSYESLPNDNDQIKFSINDRFNNINDTFARNLGLKPTSDRINVAESKPIDDMTTSISNSIISALLPESKMKLSNSSSILQRAECESSYNFETNMLENSKTQWNS